MAHNLAKDDLGDVLFASFRQDAWHRLGTIFEEEKSAEEALQLFGHYDVAKYQLSYVLNDTEDNEKVAYLSDYYGIARVDIAGVPTKSFGVVGKNYRLVTPKDFAIAWDIAGQATKRPFPIETIGALGSGEKMFVLSKLGKRIVNGDEVDYYILGLNDMTGRGADVLKITATRVVCQNTLEYALSQAESTLKVDHDAYVIDDMVAWITEVLETANAKADAVTEAMELLANYKLDPLQERKAIEVASPIPNKPRPTGAQLYDSNRMLEWEAKREIAIVRQSTISDLYNGAAAGFDSPLFPGTAWGMYNSITEAMDHVIPSRSEKDRANGAVDGWRALSKRVAFKYLYDLCKN